MQLSAVVASAGPNRDGPPGGTPLFRAYRYPLNHPGFAGRKWVPGKSLEELQTQEAEKKGAQTKN
ncbi:MAG: hypothetical protein ACYC3I_03505 [Gemmataceae bacterium]